MTEPHTETCTRPNPNSVHLTVASVRKSVKFYRDKLGFALDGCYPNEKKPVWASFVLDGQCVMVGEQCTPKDGKQMGLGKDVIAVLKSDSKAFARHPHGVGVQVYLQVGAVDAYYKAIKKKKVEILTGPTTQFYGLRDFSIVDPDGYRLVFYTHVAQEAPVPEATAPDAMANGEAELEAVTNT